MKHVPIYIILVLLILLLTCNNNSEPVNPVIEYVHHTDTILRIDSFYHTNIEVDTVIKTATDTLIRYGNYNISEYHYIIDDSLLSGEVIAKAPFKPVIDFKYKLKSYTIKDSIYIKEMSLKGFLYGGQISITPLISIIEANIAYQSNKGDIFKAGYGYDFNNKNRIITIGYLKRF